MPKKSRFADEVGECYGEIKYRDDNHGVIQVVIGISP